MSYILEALKKSEKERTLGDVPTLETTIEGHGMRVPISWFLAAVGSVVITRQREGSDTAVRLWHAPRLGFLPVRIAKVEQGEETWYMVIQGLKGVPLPGE